MGCAVADGVAGMVARAVRSLRGLRLCAADQEERVTHLIMSGEHRTLKAWPPALWLHACAERIHTCHMGRERGGRPADLGMLGRWEGRCSCRCCWQSHRAPGW